MEKNNSSEESASEEKEEIPVGDIFIVPTSHASENSSEQVHKTVEQVDPQLIAVELDENRLKKLLSTDVNKNKDVSIREIMKKSDMGLKGAILIRLFSKFQSSIVSKLGIDMIGIDMLAGYEESKERGIQLALVDQDIQITFKRFTEEVSMKELTKTLFYFSIGYFQLSRKSEDEVKETIDSENIDLEYALEKINDIFPTFKKIFIDERDDVIAHKTANIAQNFDRTVLVIGAGHEPGVTKKINQDYDNIQVKSIEELQKEDNQSGGDSPITSSQNSD